MNFWLIFHRANGGGKIAFLRSKLWMVGANDDGSATLFFDDPENDYVAVSETYDEVMDILQRTLPVS